MCTSLDKLKLVFHSCYMCVNHNSKHFKFCFLLFAHDDSDCAVQKKNRRAKLITALERILSRYCIRLVIPVLLTVGHASFELATVCVCLCVCVGFWRCYPVAQWGRAAVCRSVWPPVWWGGRSLGPAPCPGNTSRPSSWRPHHMSLCTEDTHEQKVTTDELEDYFVM